MARISYIEDEHAWRQEFSFYQEIKVRFSETDLFGHMNNTAPFIYFEEARIEFFKHLNFMHEWMETEGETFLVVADLQCDYHAQIYFDEKLKIYVKAASVGNSSADIHYMGVREDESIGITGRGTVVQCARATGKGFPWTEEQRGILLQAQGQSS